MSDCVIYALVVIYNKDCEESAACRSLQKAENIRVILTDNSTTDNSNANFAVNNGWQYIRMGGNQGLAKAYNKAIDTIGETDALVCLFDDDTEVGKEYFEALAQKEKSDPEAKAFLPLVMDEIGLLSPSIMSGLEVKRVNAVSQIPPESINGINSGMAIRKEVFNDYRFDEGYFLDCIDHAFLRDMKQFGYKISVLDVTLKQAFFANSDPDLNALIRRFKIYKKDFRRFCGDTKEGRQYYSREVTEQKKALYLKHRKIRLLFI